MAGSQAVLQAAYIASEVCHIDPIQYPHAYAHAHMRCLMRHDGNEAYVNKQFPDK
ncbi:MAG: hypothetical protein M1840_003269 [Geoglossum simile]|nr:MAG: hypothetical protein M1840_003269 [Geoglossum simile]